jgi:hypothetical protein
VPSDPASSVLFLGRPSSRSSSMSWSRPTTTAGDDVNMLAFLSMFFENWRQGVSYLSRSSIRGSEHSLYQAVVPRRARRRLEIQLMLAACGQCRHVKVQDLASYTPGECIIFKFAGASIVIELSRLAPPPSPFTLQGLFLQQQLAFRPESNSRYMRVATCTWACWADSDADA